MPDLTNVYMWDYWKKKRGSPSEALEADYPELLKSDASLQMALYQVKYGQAQIEAIMQQKIKEYE